jgi:hypothetical protein
MLPYDQYIVTELGPMKIGCLYDWYKNCDNAPRVLSYNHFGAGFDYKKILNAKTRVCEIIVLVSHDQGNFMCTKMQNVLTVVDYKPAFSLKENDVISGYEERFMSVSGVMDITNDFMYVYDIEVEHNRTYVLHNGPIVYGL